MSDEIISEKIAQAEKILDVLDIDCWMTFVRETSGFADPALSLIFEHGLTWQSALIITRHGRRIAIVGTHDGDMVRSTGDWPGVIGYIDGISTPLVQTLSELNPQTIAINYSSDNVTADGLTHGMHLLLQQYLNDTPYANRLVSAEHIIRDLRGTKSPSELARMREAIRMTENIFAETAQWAQPGRSEAEISEFMHAQATQRDVGLAWDEAHCPIVNTGPGSMAGHGTPSAELSIRNGCLFHLDFGVQFEGYCSDIQRVWYVPEGGEPAPPEDVMRAFNTVVDAIHAAKDALRPGVECWTVDLLARTIVIDAGYPEYDHATGHQVGRSAHDGGGVLGPRWERYGSTPMERIRPGQVYTLELGIADVAGRGYLGLEEMVLVTDDGCEYMTQPQQSLPLLR